MRTAATLPGRLCNLFSAIFFLTATGGGAHGLHHCPYHEAQLQRAAHGPMAMQMDTRAVDAGTLSVPPSHQQNTGVPCTCVGKCDASSAATHPSEAPQLLSDLGPTPDSGATADVKRNPLRPRHGRFELHQPNAPPSLL